MVGAWIIIDIQLCVPTGRRMSERGCPAEQSDWVVCLDCRPVGSLLVAWRESDDQPQCGGDVHAFHHERGGGVTVMPGEHECGCDDEGDHREGEFDAAARVVRLPPGFDIVVHDVFLSS